MAKRIALATLLVRDYEEALTFFVGPLGVARVEDRPLDVAGKCWIVVGPPGAGIGRLLARADDERQRAATGSPRNRGNLVEPRSWGGRRLDAGPARPMFGTSLAGERLDPKPNHPVPHRATPVSPGYLPFAGALDLPAFLCDNCGYWQRHFETPLSCPLCLDARHVVPQTGWRFRTLAEAQAEFPCHWEELEPGVWRFWNDPVRGIGSMSYLLQGAAGNLMFEGCAAFSAEALAFMASLGGVQVLSASHPHSYGALWQIQDRFDPELALHPGDLAWSGSVCVSWPFDDALEPLPGLTLHLTAGHFDGHTVLHDRTRGILFCGDALKFELDLKERRHATTISAHKAFVRGIPLSPSELRRYRDVFAPLAFDQTWTPFEQVTNSGREEALALIDSMLATRSHARPVPLHELAAT